jgi:hypothetical protein
MAALGVDRTTTGAQQQRGDRREHRDREPPSQPADFAASLRDCRPDLHCF